MKYKDDCKDAFWGEFQKLSTDYVADGDFMIAVALLRQHFENGKSISIVMHEPYDRASHYGKIVEIDLTDNRFTLTLSDETCVTLVLNPAMIEYRADKECVYFNADNQSITIRFCRD